MKIGVPKETASNERRVALVPDVVARLVKAGFEVVVEKGAGAGARLPDEAYRAAGAMLAPDQASVLGQADIVLKVQRPTDREVELLRQDSALVGMLQAAADGPLAGRLAARRVTAFSLELLPRITRAQPMDVLSSQATVAGYKAVLLAAQASPKFFPMLTTAAGTLPPARVMILGAGVAGLQAIATARRLGAVVSAFDVRPAVKEQVESLGATFLAMEMAEQAEGAGGYAKQLSEESHRRELAFIAGHVRDADVVITTALIPGQRAPILVTADAVRAMKPGSVVVDLAAEQGGNCELTEPGAEIVHGEVTILGPLNLAATLPFHASQMYAKNVSAFLQHIAKDGKLTLDFNDEITKATCVAHGGKALRS